MPVRSRCFVPYALIAFTTVMSACPGTIENRERFLDSAAACSDPLDVPDAVFRTHCNDAICHDSDQPAGGLDLDSPDVLSRLLGVRGTECVQRLRIDPGDPGRSLLLEKLESIAPECGDRMPLGSPLPANVVDCVRQWVDLVTEGAGDAGQTRPDASPDASDGGRVRDASDGSSER
jgi:hypothetical protein